MTSSAPPPRGEKRPPWFTPERARALCDRIAAGETLKDICAEPGMPGQPTIYKWLRREPQFAEDYYVARRAALRWEARHKAAYAKPPRPKLKAGRPTKCTPEVIDEICERLGAGESLTDICDDAHMPSMVSVHNWLRNDQAFRARYVDARRAQADRAFDEVREVARAATPATVAVARLNCDVIRWQAARLWPRRYGYYAGEDDEPEDKGFQVVLRQFDMVDGKVVEVMTPIDAVSYEDANRRALPAPEKG